MTVYSGRATNWVLFWIMNVLAVVLVVSGATDRTELLPLAITAGALLVVNLTMTSVRTTAGPNGVVVRYGVLGLPRFHFASSTIEHADAVDLPFSRLGGLGIHWSPRRGTRLTIRTGPQLELRMRTGRTVIISADDPQSAADVINASGR
ncbi:hypothetical protein [uncultured Jatrophihabitans sp.]|uniref:hypothetical protein n=1 Tax=uncultured Jatrophihabitans sp. TaxID=1610747 RepID=UPI0035CA629D